MKTNYAISVTKHVKASQFASNLSKLLSIYLKVYSKPAQHKFELLCHVSNSIYVDIVMCVFVQLVLHL